MPLVQVVPPVQVTPQEPQLSGSEFVFTHWPPQDVAPAQFMTQLPPMQDWPVAHFMPHMPQLSGSVLRLVQTPLQAMRPGPQLQVPFRHSWPVGQTRPQPPQLSSSSLVLTQAPPHGVWSTPQAAWHTPVEHTCPAAQPRPHTPQLFGSLVRFAHWGGVPHATTPQAPQLSSSDLRSTHEPAQFVRPVEQAAVHVPWLQAWPDGQTMLHAPQFRGSLRRSTQTPPHRS
jgi:hypothetical protein